MDSRIGLVDLITELEVLLPNGLWKEYELVVQVINNYYPIQPKTYPPSNWPVSPPYGPDYPVIYCGTAGVHYPSNSL